MMKARIDKKQFLKAGVLLIAALMVLSTVLVMADTSEEQESIFIEATQNGEEIITSVNFHPLESPIYLYYDSDTNVNAIGLTNGGTMEAAARFTPVELTPYDGWELTTVRWHHDYTSEPPHDVIIKIYETTNPTNPGTPITTEPFHAPQEGWFEVPLTSPVTIDISNDYWIGIESTHLAGEFPHGVGPGPHVVGKGDWVKLGGGPWQSLYDASGGTLDYNWNIQAGLEEGGGPLECDADGPYEGYVGEEIQFDGSASGGTPPYKWHWDFGDGNHSDEEDPVHAYGAADVYIVILMVVDSDGGTATDDTTATITEPEPLVADANGPYEANIGEEIQFHGNASGGASPYSWHWDFGNGDTSEEQNPVYAYDEADVYDVTLTVTDSEQNTDDDETTATITCPIEIEIIGGIGVTAVITNTGEVNLTDISWTITVEGGLIVIRGNATGTIDNLPAGEEVIVSLIPIGLGRVTITVTAGCAEETTDGILLLIFVLGI